MVMVRRRSSSVLTCNHCPYALAWHQRIAQVARDYADRGAPDSDYDDPGQNAAWLRGALDAILAGEQPARPATKPVGCSIKWKR